MSEHPSPFDGPLADLYGKLPDPRRDGPASAPSGAPLSRRAARAAQQRNDPHGDLPPADGSETREQHGQPGSKSVPEPDEQTEPGTSGTLDDLFAGEAETGGLARTPSAKERRRSRTGGWFALALVLVLVGAIAAGGAWAWNTYGARVQQFLAGDQLEDFEPGQAHGEATVTVSEGDAGRQVSQKLYDAGVLKAPTTLYDYMIQTSTAFTFQPGVFRLQQQMTAAAALEALADPANRIENTAMLPEGLTVEQTIARISEQMTMPIEELQSAVADPAAYGVEADSLEGWLFPATYTFDPGASARDVVARMVARATEALDAAGVPPADRQRILTVASIVQREARFQDDFYKVSRVIYNRLDPGNTETSGLLQMDSTAQYGYQELHDGTVSSSGEALADDNPWNTYVHPGLPVGPIAKPGDLAIDAALHPAEGPWLYFVTVNLDTGETVFTNTGAEHEKAVAQWQAWCRENPDSGC